MNIYRVSNIDIQKELQKARNLEVTNAELTSEVKQLKGRIKGLEAKIEELRERIRISEIKNSEPTPAMLISALPEIKKLYEDIAIINMQKDLKTGKWVELAPKEKRPYRKRNPTT